MNNDFHEDLADKLNTVCAEYINVDPEVNPVLHLMAALAIWVPREDAHRYVDGVYDSVDYVESRLKRNEP